MKTINYYFTPIFILRNLLRPPLLRFEVRTNLIFSQSGEDCPLTDTGENVQKWTRYFLLFFRRVRETSMTQHRVENTRVHFWKFSPVSVTTQPTVPPKFYNYFRISNSTLIESSTRADSKNNTFEDFHSNLGTLK